MRRWVFPALASARRAGTFDSTDALALPLVDVLAKARQLVRRLEPLLEPLRRLGLAVSHEQH